MILVKEKNNELVKCKFIIVSIAITKHNARSCESKYKLLSKFVEIQNLSQTKFVEIQNSVKICQNSKFVEIQNLSKYKICRNSKFVEIQNSSEFKALSEIQGFSFNFEK